MNSKKIKMVKILKSIFLCSFKSMIRSKELLHIDTPERHNRRSHHHASMIVHHSRVRLDHNSRNLCCIEITEIEAACSTVIILDCQLSTIDKRHVIVYRIRNDMVYVFGIFQKFRVPWDPPSRNSTIRKTFNWPVHPVESSSLIYRTTHKSRKSVPDDSFSILSIPRSLATTFDSSWWFRARVRLRTSSSARERTWGLWCSSMRRCKSWWLPRIFPWAP